MGIYRSMLVGLLAVASCRSVDAFRPDPLPYARHLPADAVMYAAFPDLPAFLRSIKTSEAVDRMTHHVSWPLAADTLGLDAIASRIEQLEKNLCLVTPQAAAYARRTDAGRLQWILLLTPKPGVPAIKGILVDGDLRLAQRDGIVAVAPDEVSIRRHLDAPSRPPEGIAQCYERLAHRSPTEPYVYLSLNRWRPAWTEACDLGWQDLREVGLRLRLDETIAVTGFAQYRPQSFRTVITADMQAPRRRVDPPADIAGWVMRSGPLRNVPTDTRGWAIAAVADGGSLGMIGLVEEKRARDAGAFAARFPRSGFLARANGRFVVLGQSAALLERNVGIEALLPADSPDGDHVSVRLTRDTLPYFVHHALPALANLKPDAVPPSLERTLASLQWIERLQWGMRYTADGAVMHAEVEIAPDDSITRKR